MKKVPIIGDLENTLDKTFKDLMGPFKDFYPLIKLGVIYSNPSSAIAYTLYRSVPHLVNGLTSEKAIKNYKTCGKAVGKGALIAGAASAKFLAKTTGKALMGVAKLGTRQFQNVVGYFSNKQNSKNKVRERLEDFEMNEANLPDAETNVSLNSLNNPSRGRRIILTNNSRERILDEENTIPATENIENTEVENTVGQRNVVERNTNIEQDHVPEQESDEITQDENQPQILNNISIGGGDAVVFTRENGAIIRQYRIAGNLGQKIQVTEEQYNAFIASAEMNNENSLEPQVQRVYDNELQ